MTTRCLRKDGSSQVKDGTLDPVEKAEKVMLLEIGKQPLARHDSKGPSSLTQHKEGFVTHDAFSERVEIREHPKTPARNAWQWTAVTAKLLRRYSLVHGLQSMRSTLVCLMA